MTGRWTFCSWCGCVGWEPWGRDLHTALGTCPNTSWRGMGEDVLEQAAAECDLLNDLEAIVAQAVADCDAGD